MAKNHSAPRMKYRVLKLGFNNGSLTFGSWPSVAANQPEPPQTRSRVHFNAVCVEDDWSDLVRCIRERDIRHVPVVLVSVDDSQFAASANPPGRPTAMKSELPPRPRICCLRRGPVGSSVRAAGFHAGQDLDLERTADPVRGGVIAGSAKLALNPDFDDLQKACSDSSRRGLRGRYPSLRRRFPPHTRMCLGRQTR